MSKNIEQHRKQEFIEMHRHLVKHEYDKVAECTANPKNNYKPFSPTTVRMVLTGLRTNEQIVDAAFEYIKRKLQLIRDLNAESIDKQKQKVA